MHIWADVEDESGNKIGSGPLDTVSAYQASPVLNGAGAYSFNVSVADPKLPYLLEKISGVQRIVKKRVRVWGLLGEQRRELGGGIVERVAHIAPDKVRLEGGDLLSELKNRRIFDTFAEETTYTPTVLWYDGDTDTFTTVNSLTTVTLKQQNSFLYVGYAFPFNAIVFDMGTAVNTVPDPEGSWGFSVEGAQETGDGWREPTVDDGTRDTNNAPFAHDGNVEFVKPGNFAKVAVNGITLYWMRYDASPIVDPDTNPEGDLEPIRFNAVTVIIRTPILDDIQALIDYYNATLPTPAQWTVDPAWYSGTTNGTLRKWEGETILEALVKIAEQTGENFRLGDGRTIQWMRKEWDDSTPLRAVQPTTPDAVESAVCYIQALEDASDTNEVITRVYVFGAGNSSDAQITLSDTSRAEPIGYVLDKDASYIEKSAAVLAFGLIEDVLRLSDIGSVDGSGANDRDASNALFDAGKAYLDAHSTPQRVLNLAIVGLNRVVLVGSEISVVYRRIVDGVIVWSVNSFQGDSPFVVLSSSNTVLGDGLRTERVQVSNVARHPKSGIGVVVDQIRALTDYRRHAQGVSNASVR